MASDYLFTDLSFRPSYDLDKAHGDRDAPMDVSLLQELENSSEVLVEDTRHSCSYAIDEFDPTDNTQIARIRPHMYVQGARDTRTRSKKRLVLPLKKGVEQVQIRFQYRASSYDQDNGISRPGYEDKIVVAVRGIGVPLEGSSGSTFFEEKNLVEKEFVTSTTWRIGVLNVFIDKDFSENISGTIPSVFSVEVRSLTDYANSIIAQNNVNSSERTGDVLIWSSGPYNDSSTVGVPAAPAINDWITYTTDVQNFAGGTTNADHFYREDANNMIIQDWYPDKLALTEQHDMDVRSATYIQWRSMSAALVYRKPNKEDQTARQDPSGKKTFDFTRSAQKLFQRPQPLWIGPQPMTPLGSDWETVEFGMTMPFTQGSGATTVHSGITKCDFSPAKIIIAPVYLHTYHQYEFIGDDITWESQENRGVIAPLNVQASLSRLTPSGSTMSYTQMDGLDIDLDKNYIATEISGRIPLLKQMAYLYEKDQTSGAALVYQEGSMDLLKDLGTTRTGSNLDYDFYELETDELFDWQDPFKVTLSLNIQTSAGSSALRKQPSYPENIDFSVDRCRTSLVGLGIWAVPQ